MTTNQTFTMIKPNAVEKGHTGAIIDQIIKGGYRILALKYVWLSQREAEKFYEIHKERPFFGELVGFMSRSPIVAIALERTMLWKPFVNSSELPILPRPLQVLFVPNMGKA